MVAPKLEDAYIYLINKLSGKEKSVEFPYRLKFLFNDCGRRTREARFSWDAGIRL